MTAKRVFISGVGGELGWRVASYLEQLEDTEALLGLDVQPPRGRLRRTHFELLGDSERERLVGLVTDFDPHLIVHLAVWEPHARSGPDRAASRTTAWATAVLGAAAECRSLQSIVLRSGIEVYGRGRGALTRPSEQAPTRPTSPYGQTMADLERVAREVGHEADVPVTMLRLATVLGPHVPSPLGRLLRLGAVPFDLLSDPAFAVIHQHDAAEAFLLAARAGLEGGGFDGPVNIAAPGAITTLQAIRHGKRIPIPVVGPQWPFARQAAFIRGAPIPFHIEELLRRGRLADSSLAKDLFNFRAPHSTIEVVDQLYSWPSIIRVPAARAVA